MNKAGYLFFFLFLLLIFSIPETYCFTAKPDTLVDIASVTVYTRRHLYYQEDKKVISLDSSLTLPAADETLGDVLRRYLPLTLLEYGTAGSLSTLSFRGSNSVQTQINWNGFPLNSLTSGIADLSQINAGMFEQIMLIPGASGSVYGSGTAGGAINLDNKPDWKEGVEAGTGLQGGSFRAYGANISLHAGSRNYQYKAQGFYHDALNNFPYRDDQKYGSPTEILDHNYFQYSGIIQTFSARFKHGIYLQSGLWLQKKRKEIPRIMGSYVSNNQEQRDSILRMYLTLEKHWRYSIMSARGAWFLDNMRFTDKSSRDAVKYTIDSRFNTKHFMSDLYFRHTPAKNWKLDAGIASSAATAQVSAYADKVRDYSVDIYGGVKVKQGRFLSSLTLRQNFNPYRNPPPQVDAGLRYIPNTEKISFHINYSTKYRLPTLNDKFWNPGGNPELQPEHGWGITGGFDMHTKNLPETPKDWSLKWQVDGFSNLLDDQIQWLPAIGYWHPENIEKIWARGLENSLKVSWKRDKLSASFFLNYYYTVSTILKNTQYPLSGHHNRYIPKHAASAIFRIDYAGFYGGLYENYTGRRYTTFDNNPAYKLGHYTLTDIILGTRTDCRSLTNNIQFIIKNLFNNRYQVIRSYPMPGRTYYLKIALTFQTKNK